MPASITRASICGLIEAQNRLVLEDSTGDSTVRAFVPSPSRMNHHFKPFWLGVYPGMPPTGFEPVQPP